MPVSVRRNWIRDSMESLAREACGDRCSGGSATRWPPTPRTPPPPSAARRTFRQPGGARLRVGTRAVVEALVEGRDAAEICPPPGRHHQDPGGPGVLRLPGAVRFVFLLKEPCGRSWRASGRDAALSAELAELERQIDQRGPGGLRRLRAVIASRILRAAGQRGQAKRRRDRREIEPASASLSGVGRELRRTATVQRRDVADLPQRSEVAANEGSGFPGSRGRSFLARPARRGRDGAGSDLRRRDPLPGLVVFLGGLSYRVLGWATVPVPFRIPTTCGQQKSLPWIKQAKLDNPSGTLGVLGRMALEVRLLPLAVPQHEARNCSTGADWSTGPAWGSGSGPGLPLVDAGDSDPAPAALHSNPCPSCVTFLQEADGFLEIGVPVFYVTRRLSGGAGIPALAAACQPAGRATSRCWTTTSCCSCCWASA